MQEMSASDFSPHEEVSSVQQNLSLHSFFSIELVNKLEDLVRYTLECEHRQMAPDTSFTEVFKQLQDLQKAISVMELQRKDMEKSLSEMMQQGGIAVPVDEPAISLEEKKLLNRLDSLTTCCTAAKDRLQIIINKDLDAKKKVAEKIRDAVEPEEKRHARRKGKFKAIGSKKGWIPL